jgi:hypothetical protein
VRIKIQPTRDKESGKYKSQRHKKKTKLKENPQKKPLKMPSSIVEEARL